MRQNESLVSLIQLIQEKYRLRQDYVNATTRLILQCKSMCRRFTEGDKKEADRMYEAIRKGVYEDDLVPAAVWLETFLEALALMEEHRKEIEKELKKLVKELPVWSWVSTQKGVGDLSLAKLVGESGDLLKYDTVAKLWKRMGLAVIEGERQRKCSDKDKALLHGYSPVRRSVMWNIGSSIMKAQIRKDPDDEEKRITLGELGDVYLDRKQYELERTEGISNGHAHARAQRYVEKRFLRLLWEEWHRIMPEIEDYEYQDLVAA